tara:strand:+ start:657 stop:1400 length:744 start_codon:yes stop_codon:yes gene_type:complete
MAKIKDIKTNNPKYVIDVIDVLGVNDPTKTNKYLPFMIRQTKDWVEWVHNELNNETFKEMFEVIKDFEDLSKRNLLENKDIYSYESNQDIIDAVKLAKERVTHSEVKKKETEVLFEDDRWVVIYPLTTRSSNMYGKATKWCVSSEDQNYGRYFKQYTENGVLIFVIDKSVKDRDCRENILSKVAFHNDKSKSDGITAWDVQDSQLSVSNTMKFSSMIGPKVIQIVYDRLENGKTNLDVAKEKGLRQD